MNMHTRHLGIFLVFASVLACRLAPTESPAVPAAIDPEFAGPPVRVATLESGIIMEVLDEGQGERASDGQLAVFEYSAFPADTMEPMPPYSRRFEVGAETHNPIHAALQLVIADQQPGFRARVFVPAAFVDAHKPARAPAVGDVWLTVALEQVREYPQIVGLDAFAGEPLATKVLPDGAEIHDHAPGTGPTAVDGKRVEFAMLSITVDGRQVLSDAPDQIFHTLAVGDPDFPNPMLEGARVGMLREYIIPRGYKNSRGESSDVEMVIACQVTWIEP